MGAVMAKHQSANGYGRKGSETDGPCSLNLSTPTRRNLLKTAGAAGLVAANGLASRANAAQDARPGGTWTNNGVVDPNALPNIQAPSLKRPALSPIQGRWASMANLPIPVQEVYPAPFWTQSIADQQSRRALRAQRFNVIVCAGGITGLDRGRFRATDETFIYDPIADRWSDGPRLPQTRHHLHLVAHNGFLFGIGGFSISSNRRRPQTGGWTMVDDVLRLDRLDGRWQRVRSLPIPQAEAACVSVGGFIHIAGGRSPVGSQNGQWSDHIDTDKHYVYDSRTDNWFEARPMITPRNSMAAVGIRGAIYTFGGRTVNGGNVDVTEAYDPLSDRWQTMRPMPRAQAGLAAAAIGNSVFVFGGEYFGNRAGAGGVFSEVWAFDTSEDRWRSAGLMPRPRHGLGAVTLANSIYTIGGASQPGGNGTSPAVDRMIAF